MLTLPQEDLTGAEDFFSVANSSARPQEQSLQAFRFPVVPHTEIRVRNNKFMYKN
jgi:hypothetical protein